MFSLFIPTAVLHSQNTKKEKLHDLYKTQDVNGFMPEQVYIKTMTQTYCKNYSFVVVDGRIYVKRDGDEKWILFLKKGLPFSEESKRKKSYLKHRKQSVKFAPTRTAFLHLMRTALCTTAT